MAYNISNAAAKVVNNAGGIVVDGSAVEGGYFVTDSIEVTSLGEPGKIPEYACVFGALCYCTADSNFYQYNGLTWVKTFSPVATSGQFKDLTISDDVVLLLDGGGAEDWLEFK